jgi:hypothetical protein
MRQTDSHEVRPLAPVRHLLIAGTGRLGTSALVRYRAGLGLGTHLTKRGNAAEGTDFAEAGLEDLPLTRYAVEYSELQHDYFEGWQGLEKHFSGKK